MKGLKKIKKEKEHKNVRKKSIKTEKNFFIALACLPLPPLLFFSFLHLLPPFDGGMEKIIEERKRWRRNKKSKRKKKIGGQEHMEEGETQNNRWRTKKVLKKTKKYKKRKEKPESNER